MPNDGQGSTQPSSQPSSPTPPKPIPPIVPDQSTMGICKKSTDSVPGKETAAITPQKVERRSDP